MMKISQAELLSWEIVAAVLQQAEPIEYEMLPEIIESSANRHRAIGDQLAAFDAPSGLILANALRDAVLAVINNIYPPLVDAVIDIGKDALKDWMEKELRPQTRHRAAQANSVDLQLIYDSVKAAMTRQGFDLQAAEDAASAAVGRYVLSAPKH